MANGSTRLALAKVQLKKESAQAEHSELLAMQNGKKKGAMEALPLKAGKK